MNYYDMNTPEVLSQLDTSMNGLTADEQKKHCNILGQKLLWKMFSCY